MTITFVSEIRSFSKKVKRMLQNFEGGRLIILTPDDLEQKLRDTASGKDIIIVPLSSLWDTRDMAPPDWYLSSKKKPAVRSSFLERIHRLAECISHATEYLIWVPAQNLKLIKDHRWPNKRELRARKHRLLIGSDIVGGEVEIIRKANAAITPLVFPLEHRFAKTGELSKELDDLLGVKIVKVHFEDLLREPDCCDSGSDSSSSECASSSTSRPSSESSSSESSSSDTRSSESSSSDTRSSESSSSDTRSSESSSSDTRSSESSSSQDPPAPPPATSNGYGWVVLGILLAVLLITLIYCWYLWAGA